MGGVKDWARRVARRPAAALFALLLGTYAYFYQAGGWNQNSRFDLVRAMVEDGRLQTDRFAKNTGDDAVRGGHHYCDKAPGSSWLCAPPYAVMYWLSGSPHDYGPLWLGWAAWLSIVIETSSPATTETGWSNGKNAWAKFVVLLSPGTLPMRISPASVVTKHPHKPCAIPSRWIVVTTEPPK